MWRRSVEDYQVELAEALGVGEDVHLDDPSVSDREARDRERPPVPEGDRADRAVDERRPHLDAPPHDWWDWYAAYMDARQSGSTPDEASAAAGRYMVDVKHVGVV
jgi:hypothetical protein